LKVEHLQPVIELDGDHQCVPEPKDQRIKCLMGVADRLTVTKDALNRANRVM
jgi:hypothetical protein